MAVLRLEWRQLCKEGGVARKGETLYNYTRNATALKLADPATRGRAIGPAIGKPCNHATRAWAQTM